MAEGEEGWTWPTWGSGKGRSAEDRIEGLQADLEDTMEGGDIEEQIVEEDVEAEEVDDTKVQAVGTVEEHAAVVVEEEEEVDANEVLELRLQEIFADIDRKHAHIDKLFTKADRIRTTVLEPTIHTSTCEACIQPMVCNNCGVRGDHTIFLCSGCRLPVPSELRCCNVCGKSILPSNSWCKDCATTAGLDKQGIFIMCGRNPSELSKTEGNDFFVSDTEV
jgi:hypothetical protein